MMMKKILIVGDGGAGKTCFISVFQKGQFPEHYIPTVVETCVITQEWKNKEVFLVIFIYKYLYIKFFIDELILNV